MPEGHVIHRLARRHHDLFVGERVRMSSPQGRFGAGARLLSGSVLRETEAYGKHLLHHYANGLILHVHLGLYGKLADGMLPAPPPVGEVRLRMSGRAHWLDLRGPAACEVYDAGQAGALRSRLGPDPLRPGADPDAAWARLRARRAPLAGLLMDQSIVAGAGLIFVTEVLYRAGLAPDLPGHALRPDQWQMIWADLCGLMAAAARTGRIDTVRAAHTAEAMQRPPRQDRHGGEVYVYRRAGQTCLVCAATVRQARLAGRNSYWCPRCQPEVKPSAPSPGAATAPAGSGHRRG